MNDQLTEAPPDPLSVRFNVKYSEWLVWDSFEERVASGGHATEKAAEAALKRLQAKRGTR
jgi:hypothetical protein